MTVPAQESAILEAVTRLIEPGAVAELRALEVSTPDYQRAHTVSGYFDDLPQFAKAARSIKGAKGIYRTINRLNPALLARATPEEMQRVIEGLNEIIGT